MTNRTEIKARLEFRKDALQKLRAAYIALVDGGVQSYSVGSRTLTRLDLSRLSEEIKRLEKEIDGLEEQLRGGRARKAVAVVPRDW